MCPAREVYAGHLHLPSREGIGDRLAARAAVRPAAEVPAAPLPFTMQSRGSVSSHGYVRRGPYLLKGGALIPNTKLRPNHRVSGNCAVDIIAIHGPASRFVQILRCCLRATGRARESYKAASI